MMAKLLPSVDVREMNLDERDCHPKQGITQADAGMGESRGIDDNESNRFFAGLVDARDQLVFRVALKGRELVTGLLGQRLLSGIDFRQPHGSVVLRLPLPQKIQVGTMQHQELGHGI